jgi:hypothetical protein
MKTLERRTSSLIPGTKVFLPLYGNFLSASPTLSQLQSIYGSLRRSFALAALMMPEAKKQSGSRRFSDKK